MLHRRYHNEDTHFCHEFGSMCRRPEVSSVCCSFLLPSPTLGSTPFKVTLSCTLARNLTYVKPFCGQFLYVFCLCGWRSKKPKGVVFDLSRFCANVELDSLTQITSTTVCYGSDGNLLWLVHFDEDKGVAESISVKSCRVCP